MVYLVVFDVFTLTLKRSYGTLLCMTLFLMELAPHDCYQRRKWISGIQLSYPIMLYKYVYGNHMGTLVYTWRIPEDQPVDSTITSRIFMQLCTKQLHFSTRAMRQEFLNHYSRIAKTTPMVLRNICDPFWENLPICADNFFSDLLIKA